jgi:hypothetical protein
MKRFPDIFLGALLAVAIFAIGMAVGFNYQPSNAESGGDSKNQTSQVKSESFGQWLSRDATGFFTPWLVIIGGVQLGFFLWQLVLIRESLDDAKIAADAAKESADAAKQLAQATTSQAAIARDTLGTMQDTAQREMRAYCVPIYVGLVHQDATFRFEPRLQLLNTGRTPAYDVSYRANADVLPFPLPDDFDFPHPDFPAQSNATLGTAQTFTMAAAIPNRLSDEEIETIKIGVSHRIYIWGTAFYRDAFGADRHTHFCQSIVWFADRATTTGNFTKRHNDAN